jgi:AcrR family transcriptional regulator
MLRGRNRGPIWTRPAPGARQPRFSREQIAQTAVAIADKEGFAEVSMRRIAEVLGAGTMTLYHYVRTKDDLLALMDDALMAEALIPEHELPRGWRAGLSAIARRSRDTMIRHPWALLSMHGVRMGPGSVRHIEQTMAAVADAPFPLEQRLALITAVDDFVFGYALRAGESPRDAFQDPHAVRALNQLVSGHLATGQFPHLAAFVGKEPPAQAFARALEIMNDEQRFDFGLEALLDGAEARGKAGARPSKGRRASRRNQRG